MSYTVNSLADMIRAELANDPGGGLGGTPARMLNIIREAGVKLWNNADWRFQKVPATLTIAAAATTIELPDHFRELEGRWQLENEAKGWLRFTEDLQQYQHEAAANYGNTARPRLACICQDTDRRHYKWQCRITPASDAAYTYGIWYLRSAPWQRVSTLTNGPLRFTALGRGADSNNITLAYTDDGTAGAEVVTVAGQTISVSLDVAVSTAAQVKLALEESDAASALIEVEYSTGETGTTAIAAALTATNLAGALTDDQAPLWPPDFDEGWHHLALGRCQRAFQGGDGYRETFSAFKDWLAGQVEESNETITESNEYIPDGYGDLGSSTVPTVPGYLSNT